MKFKLKISSFSEKLVCFHGNFFDIKWYYAKNPFKIRLNPDIGDKSTDSGTLVLKYKLHSRVDVQIAYTLHNIVRIIAVICVS
jgi:hypothetical protein